MAALGVEYLRFADNLAKHRREALEADRHSELMDYLFKNALVASRGYTEQSVFADRFANESVTETVDGSVPTTNDADVDLDYSAVEWSSPTEDELAIMERMLGNTSVTVPAEPDQEQPLAPPREIPVQDVDQDREWV